MIPYAAPLADMRFILTRLIGLQRLAALPSYDAVNEELVDAILNEAARISSAEFAPLNDSGDKEGAKFLDGKVTSPKGFREAYRTHVDGGWNSLPVESEHGGQGLPWCLAMPVQEMWQASNLSFALCTLLNQGAIELLAAHGDPNLKAKFLPKLVSGDWTGTMNITESQAGSDVGAIACKAERGADGYKITGQKIFISYGEHDFAENILHFVLARLPDAPPGTRGLTLFLVPKIMVKEDGTLGTANDVRAVSMEHKLGQHGGPTCVMAFGDQGGAVGYRVGAEHGGINAMFTMMNNARVGVGIQGLALMERAYQQARDYAKTRIQSRDITNPKAPPVPILRHPDVRRMLMLMRAKTEAARALAMTCAFAVDTGKRSAEEQRRIEATERADLLTPVVKGWLTELANEVASLGVQVHGGMGYIEETGAAQHMRDARVLGIYEGTNGIQANDFVFRKLLRDDGKALHELLAEAEELVGRLAKQPEPEFAAMAKNLESSLGFLRDSSNWIRAQAKTAPNRAAVGAFPLLMLAGNTLGGFYLIQLALLAREDLKAGGGDVAFLEAKIATALFFAEHVLPQNVGLAAAIIVGADSVLMLKEACF